VLSEAIPMGTDGFEFVEYASPDPEALGALFATMGFAPVARHRSKNVTLWRQGNVNFVVNTEPESFARRFAEAHGPSACAMGIRVVDSRHACERALALGAKPSETRIGPMELNIPAIAGTAAASSTSSIATARAGRSGMSISSGLASASRDLPVLASTTSTT
jgi:4-hydroxyphenylpyruvate dioxygenase